MLFTKITVVKSLPSQLLYRINRSPSSPCSCWFPLSLPLPQKLFPSIQQITNTTLQQRFRTISFPFSWYSLFEIHSCWKEPNEHYASHPHKPLYNDRSARPRIERTINRLRQIQLRLIALHSHPSPSPYAIKQLPQLIIQPLRESFHTRPASSQHHIIRKLLPNLPIIPLSLILSHPHRISARTETSYPAAAAFSPTHHAPSKPEPSPSPPSSPRGDSTNPGPNAPPYYQAACTKSASTAAVCVQNPIKKVNTLATAVWERVGSSIPSYPEWYSASNPPSRCYHLRVRHERRPRVGELDLLDVGDHAFDRLLLDKTRRRHLDLLRFQLLTEQLVEVVPAVGRHDAR